MKKDDMTVNRGAAGQFVRLGEHARPALAIRIDGRQVSCLAGDTVLTAVLLQGGYLRQSEFGDGPRAGFCNMGACQDCWMYLGDGRRIRACSTYVEAGMDIFTADPAPHVA